MQTRLIGSIAKTKSGEIASSILRRCVHCGFCNATCPTYQLTGDELDGPRGRIYLIKQALEGKQTSEKTRYHLDRCLQCRACETTCPSGVRYAELLHVGQQAINQQLVRPLFDKVLRKSLNFFLPRTGLFKTILIVGRLFKPFLPAGLANKIPRRQKIQSYSQQPGHKKNVIVLDGCIQRSATPATNIATARVLDKLGIQTIHTAKVECCAAIPAHLDEPEQARAMIKKNIDLWWPLINDNTVAILSTASGCSLMISEYADYLAGEAGYFDKATKIKNLNKDLSEILVKENFAGSKESKNNKKLVSYHAPCTQQHGLGINGVVESILKEAGYAMVPIKDSHLCCGSAGTYSITQPALSRKLLVNKITALTHPQPDVIATANIGCQLHLQSATDVPVVHWIELVDSVLENQIKV